MTAPLYGWRHWTRTDAGELVSPLKPLPAQWAGPTAYAICPHGQDIPSPFCPCGIYFVTAAESLFDDPEIWVELRSMEVRSPHLLPQVNNLVTFGHAVGGVAVDPNRAEIWGVAQPQRPYRAAGYRIDGVLFAGESPRNTELARRFGVPWRVGINLSAACELRAHVEKTIATPTTTSPHDRLHKTGDLR